MKKMFNLRNLYSTASFFSLILIPGAVESEMYLTALVLIAVFAATAYLAIREDGQKNRPY